MPPLNDAYAQSLCTVIRGYWADRGYAVKAWVEHTPANDGKTLAVVRSDLQNGLPIGFKPSPPSSGRGIPNAAKACHARPRSNPSLIQLRP